MHIDTVKPLGDRVLVRPIPEDDTLPGGLVKPQTSMERPVVGSVVAFGPLCEAAGLSRGNHVLYGKFSGTEVVINRELHLLLRLDEIMAKVNGKEA